MHTKNNTKWHSFIYKGRYKIAFIYIQKPIENDIHLYSFWTVEPNIIYTLPNDSRPISLWTDIQMQPLIVHSRSFFCEESKGAFDYL